MKVRRIVLGFMPLLVGGGAMAAYELTPKVHAGTPGEAPELGRFGSYRVGTATIPMALPGREAITAMSAVTGNTSPAPRTVTVRYWYPATANTVGAGARYEHDLKLPGKPAYHVISQGRAIAGAAPLPGSKFPLVVMSHGYGGWNTQFSNLAEHIASRGYVVASIDHGDMPASDVGSFLLSFGNVLVDRTLDQRQVLAQIQADVAARKTPFLSQVDLSRIGLIGYSMGSYGAIGTAGAKYDFAEGPLARVPGAAREKLQQAAQQPAPIKALIVFSPWGGQPDSRAWTGSALSEIKVPVLMVAGNQDDVVNFKDGVTWLFDHMTGAQRYLLVYREARHNIVGDEFEMAEGDPFMAAEFLKEPVWRSDRLNAINQHFVTAFLDWTLKGEADKREYLDVPTAASDDGEWSTSLGEQLNGTMAGHEQGKYWRGFQRRWATGL
ncbi:MAG: alpha/beta hydrolase family protein, partial [Novosphingobium sp.]